MATTIPVTIDVEQLEDFARDLDNAETLVRAEVRKVVAKGALNIKTDAKKRIGRGPYLPGYANSIGYDTRERTTEISAEIGPDKDKNQGPLGNILDYGTPNRAPIPHLGPALAAEDPRLEKAIGDAVIKALGL